MVWSIRLVSKVCKPKRDGWQRSKFPTCLSSFRTGVWELFLILPAEILEVLIKCKVNKNTIWVFSVPTGREQCWVCSFSLSLYHQFHPHTKNSILMPQNPVFQQQSRYKFNGKVSYKGLRITWNDFMKSFCPIWNNWAFLGSRAYGLG